MREVTERQEGIEAGTAKLVGTNFDRLVEAMSELLENNSVYIQMADVVNPYGDGNASMRIVDIMRNIFL
jgi:UDP-N-acetylglucosamine 2-epimerase (non-hydrolysing)